MNDSQQLETFGVSAQAESETQTTVETRGFEFTVDEPEALGGTDEGPNPVEYLLGAWAGCLNVVAHPVAEEREIEIRDLEVALEGSLDPRKFLGIADDVRAGYQEIDATISVDTDANDEDLEAWLAAVEERCPVGDNVQNETPASVSFEKR